MLLDRHGNEYPVWLCGWPDGHPEFINAARLADPTGRRRRHDPPGSALRALPGLPQAGRQADTRQVGDRGPACSRDVAARSNSVPRGIWGLGSRHRARPEPRATTAVPTIWPKNERLPPGARLIRRRAHTGPRIANTLMASRTIVGGSMSERLTDHWLPAHLRSLFPVGRASRVR